MPSIKYLLIVFSLVLFAVVTLRAIEKSVWIAPTEQTQSTFLRSYDPAPLLKSFATPCSPNSRDTVDQYTQAGSSWESSAGYKFLNRHDDVTYKRTVEPVFCANRGDYAAMMTAVHQDIIAKLLSSACQVGSDQLTMEDGLRITYRCAAGPQA